MAETPSNMLPLGTDMPAFQLENVVDGRAVTHRDCSGKPTLVMFVCNHCPYVVHVRDELTRLAHELLSRGVNVLAINSNSEESHPQDGPMHMKTLAVTLGWRFPFLFDKTQDIARAFDAACTPDFFLFDKQAKLFYRGQLDDSRPGNKKPVTGRDLRAAADAVLLGKPAPEAQIPSVGCNIKWRR